MKGSACMRKTRIHINSPKSIKMRTCFHGILFRLWYTTPLNALGDLSEFSIK